MLVKLEKAKSSNVNEAPVCHERNSTVDGLNRKDVFRLMFANGPDADIVSASKLESDNWAFI